MRRAAGLLLAAACAAVLTGACARRLPPEGSGLPGRPFAASFSASASGEAGRMRISGVLAAGPGGLLRVEIAGGGESFLLVSGGRDLSAVLSRGGLHLRDGRDSGLLSGLIGLDITAPQISAVLMGDSGSLPAECEAGVRRWREAGKSGAFVATRIRIRCGQDRMKIRLAGPTMLGEDRARKAFAPLSAPPGHRSVGAPEMARALAGALSGGKASGGR